MTMQAQAGVVGVQPLLETLSDLTHAYREAGERADDLIAALASGDFTRVQSAVAAQMAALRAIEEADKRRRAAQAEVEASLLGAPGLGGHPLGMPLPLTSTDLIALLPPAEAEHLRVARHELLLTITALQAKNGQAAMLLQNAQAVIKRSLRAAAPTATGYGPTGEPALAGQPVRRRPVRWA